jgi:hypothetical protein
MNSTSKWRSSSGLRRPWKVAAVRWPLLRSPVLGPYAPSSGDDEPVHHSGEGEMGSPLLNCTLASWVADDQED